MLRLSELDSAILDVSGLLWCQLDDFLAVIPQAVLELVGAIVAAAVTGLLALVPGAGVGLLVWHHVDAVALPLVQLVEALVAASIWVLLHAEAVHFLVHPVAGVLLAVGPPVRTEAFDDSVLVVAGVSLSVGPLLDAVSIPLVARVRAEELRTVRIGFLTNALHDALFELAFVDKEIDVGRSALAVVHVVRPLAFIRLTLDLGVLAVAVAVSKTPSALVRRAIFEVHGATAMAEAAEPLAFIGCSRCPVPVLPNLQLIADFSRVHLEEKSELDDAPP